MINWTHGLINRLAMVCDGFMLLLSGIVLLLAGGREPLGLTPLQMLLLTLLAGFFHIVVLRRFGAYRVEHYGLQARQVLDLVPGLVVAAIVVALVIVTFDGHAAHRGGWLLLWGGLAYLCLLFGRVVVLGVLLRWVKARALLRRKVVVIGTGGKAPGLVAAMNDPSQSHRYEVVGLFAEDSIAELPATVGGVPVRGRLADLLAFANDTAIDIIVIAVPWEATARIHGLFERVQRLPADVVIPLDEGFSPRFARIGALANAPVLQVLYHPLKGSQGILKLAEDYVVGTVALAISAPILLAAAIAIKLDSSGPVLFLQNRVGFNNKPFKCYKLRTMRVDPSDDGSVGTKRADPRITRIGSILRKTSIDELPQLINVLKGEMSLVGPRPHVPNMLVGSEQYYDAVREYAARYRIKPGITGWAQINGMRGGIDTKEKAKRGVDLDIHYIESWSLWFDFKIMVRTVTMGLFGRDVF